MNKIEIISQPEPNPEKSKSPEPDVSTIEKLKELVRENPPVDDETPDSSSSSTDKGSNSDNPNIKSSKSHDSETAVPEHEPSVQKAHGKSEPVKVADNTAEKVDHDGFEIPEGKIPLDGHFSTSEIQQLVEIAKDEGLLNDTVTVEVVERNETLGDKVVIAEHTEQSGEKTTKQESVDPLDASSSSTST